jgi:hypothetical protein
MIRDAIFGTIFWLLIGWAGYTIFGPVEGLAYWRVFALVGLSGFAHGYMIRVEREGKVPYIRKQVGDMVLEARGARAVEHIIGKEEEDRSEGEPVPLILKLQPAFREQTGTFQSYQPVSTETGGKVHLQAPQLAETLCGLQIWGDDVERWREVDLCRTCVMHAERVEYREED